MLRVLITLVVMAGVGYLAGSVQSSIETSGYTERFRDSRETQAEINSEVSREDLLKKSVGTPKVQVDGGTRYEFGSMMHGETMSHTFTFRNVGDGPLNLTMGSTTCKCTVGDLENTILEPGEETEVALTWTAKSLLRDFGQSATIITTDPSATEVKLVVSGKIVDSFVSEPAELSLGEIQSSEGVQQTVHLMNYLDKDTAIERLVWSDERTSDYIEMSHEVVQVGTEEFTNAFPDHKNCLQAHRIKFVIKPGMPIGPLSGKIEIGTDKGEDLEDVKVSVVGRVSGEVTLMGGSSLNTKLNRLDFGSVKSSEGASLVVYLRVAPQIAKEFEATATVVQFDENLTATVGEPKHREASSLFPIRLEIPKGAPAANLVGPRGRNYCKVVIKTNCESAPEIPIYVRMVVTK